MQIVQLKTNHITNPVGFQMDRPIFSWQVTGAEGKYQKAARIKISESGDMAPLLHDTGWRSDLDSLAAPIDLPLKPQTRYYWTVSVETDAGEVAESEVNFFETGKMGGPWAARWITCERTGRHPIFQKDITVTKELVSARLYICGLGLYEAEINGVRVGNEYMTPYCNNYAAWVQAQTYDVTEQLRSGGKLSVTLADGWYMGRFGYFGRDKLCGSAYKLLAEVRLTFAGGSEEVIGTDESWSVTRSNITFSNIYDGEHRDDTLPAAQPEPVRLTEAPAPVVDRYSLPVTIHERVKPVELIHTPKGETVLDLGQNLTGIFSLRINEKPGTVVHLQVGEVLQEGCFYNENLRTAKAEYIYTCGGGEVILTPKFTFYGYRYVKVEGITNLNPDDFTALVLYSDLPETGALTTGHEKVNRLIENVKWGQKGNFLDVPTDCPQRDERMGWTGDAQVFSATSCYLRDSYAFYRKYLHDMNTEQAMLDGMVPDVVPSFDKIYQGTACVWGDAATIIPWNVYLFYGDKTILADSFDGMKAWVDYIRRYDEDTRKWREHFHYGDWLALDHPSKAADQCMGGTEEGYIAYVYYMNSAEIVSKAAKILGKGAEEEEYAALAASLREFIRNEYFAPNGRCVADTQTGLLLALQYGLSPNPDACRKRLAQKLDMTGGKLQTGFVGTPFLNRQLTEAGMVREAYDLLLNEEYPGWLYEVNLGATTIWERWNSLSPDGSVSSTGMNSFNHYAYGAIAEWMFRYMAGLQPVEDAPGFRKVKLAPVPDVRMGKVEMEYRSSAGCYCVKWNALDDRTLQLTVEIPFGCEAELTLPYAPEELYQTDNPLFKQVSGNTCRLQAGHYEITYQTTRPMRRLFTISQSMKELLADPQVTALLEEYWPHVQQLPDAMRTQSLADILANPGASRLTEEQLRELEERLSRL